MPIGESTHKLIGLKIAPPRMAITYRPVNELYIVMRWVHMQGRISSAMGAGHNRTRDCL